jgi:hypothetical protein
MKYVNIASTQATHRLNMDQMRTELRRQVDKAHGVVAWCRTVGIENHAPVSLALSGTRPITEAIANAAGFTIAPVEFIRYRS